MTNEPAIQGLNALLKAVRNEVETLESSSISEKRDRELLKGIKEARIDNWKEMPN